MGKSRIDGTCWITAVVMTVIGLWSATAQGAPTATQKCEGAKNKVAGKYALCRQSAEAKFALTGDTVKYDAAILTCEGKFAAAWQKAIDKAMAAGATCVDEPLTEAELRIVIDAHTDNVATALDGGELRPPVGLPETGQTQCDQGAGTLGSCPGSPAGQDGSLTPGLTRAGSLTNNVDGTISDSLTGLMWETLDNNNVDPLHDYNTTYSWYDGFKKIQVLNGNNVGCIASANPAACCTGAGTGSCTALLGHTDWRLPTLLELESIVNLDTFTPSTYAAFNSACPGSTCTTTATPCSCTFPAFYWSSSTFRGFPNEAWFVNFSIGDASKASKSNLNRVRAVRGGL